MHRAERDYQYDRELLLNAIWDMMEVQRGEVTVDRAGEGIIGFRTQIYGSGHEYRFSVTDTELGSRVILEMDDGMGERMIFKAFALLESLTRDAAPANKSAFGSIALMKPKKEGGGI
jgi:hypothetical protein